MALYIPVLTERRDAMYLRGQVEGVLSGDNPQPIQDRIAQLEACARSQALAVRFGSEIEFSFVPNPHREEVAITHGVNDGDGVNTHRAELYERVLESANPSSIAPKGMSYYDKGHIVQPGKVKGNVLKTEHPHINSDGQDTSIIEVQTTPGTGKQAIERYWRVVRAIGRTADEYGLMANILSTHISSTIATRQYGKPIYLLPFAEEYKPYLALVQHNLNALQPLQLDAGLDKGWTVLEAFPRSKNATTTIHDNRLELRHPTTGVIDPRVDVLAVLAAAVAMDSAPQTALEATRPMWIYKYSNDREIYRPYAIRAGIGELLHTAGVDERTGQLVMPAQLSQSSTGLHGAERMINLAEHLLPGQGKHVYDDGGEALRRLMQGIRVVNGSFVIPKDHPYYDRLHKGLAGIGLLGARRTLRVDPLIIADSPDLQRERLYTIKQSPRIRKIFGSALPAVVGADESMARKDRLVASQMVVVE